MTETRLTRMFQRRDTLANWTADNPVLGDGEIAIIEKAPDADQLKIGDGVRHFNDLPLFGGAASGAFSANAIFGEGEDGDLVLPSGLTTFNQNKNFHNLHIPADAVLDPGGYVVVVSGVLSGSGKIVADGEDATDVSYGAGYTGYSGGGRNGASSPFNGLRGCSKGGDGGLGTYSSGGIGQVDLATPNNSGLMADIVTIIAQYSYGGGGGAGGGQGGGAPGGYGGGGAGFIWLAAATNAFIGTISANGGKGGDAGPGDGGGGGGGGGGLIVFIAGAGVDLPTITADGGLGGAGDGAGESGQQGGTGHVGRYGYGLGSSTPVSVTVNVTEGTGGGGDGLHTGTGTDSVQVGNLATATGLESTATGKSASADGWRGAAFGAFSFATGDDSTAMGHLANADAQKSTVLGSGAEAHGERSIALGAGAVVTEDDHGIVNVDNFEVVASSGAGNATALIITDVASQRWKITVDTTGHLTTELL